MYCDYLLTGEWRKAASIERYIQIVNYPAFYFCSSFRIIVILVYFELHLK